MSNRLPRAAHAEMPWRIHEIAPEFHLQDVWAFPAPGAGPDDFPLALATLRDRPPTSWPSRFLFAVRWRLGALLGWDRPRAGLGARVPSLRDRLPADLRDTAGPAVPNTPFTPLYELHDEAALELANETVHGIAHFGWVPTPDGYDLRMAVLVRPNGLLGHLYMAAIEPFRLLTVYPAMLRGWNNAWRQHNSTETSDTTHTGNVS
ncbi:DUF2867 domain-containing protein [Nocardia yunnanensis]|uniref:DUF2867 domain-containing protein n=1 Tax=Nocardia yunnanensis TaxID=2382165 RepID=A0A386ZCA9_9NOCA|nr:DUF2867 domain-containing protein [Nocardia yunnanensis]AYF74803.1 DUF2867 domain-containing protein [Nocardia yunnanensis]